MVPSCLSSVREIEFLHYLNLRGNTSGMLRNINRWSGRFSRKWSQDKRVNFSVTAEYLE